MQSFRARLRSAIDSSPIYRKRASQLSIDAGLGEKTVNNILNDKRLDYSKTGPGIFGMARVASLLDISLDNLVSTTPEKQSKPVNPFKEHVEHSLKIQSETEQGIISSDSLLRLHMKSGGRFEAFEAVLKHCDQYSIPNEADTDLSVIKVGSSSLSALIMGNDNADMLQSALSLTQDDDLKARWIKGYRLAAEFGALTTIESLDSQMPNRPVRVKIDYLRVLLAVQNSNDERIILNFSLLLV